jgi:hypothetical protein
MVKLPANLDKEFADTLEGLAIANNTSIALIIAALHNSAIWDVIGGGIGPVDPRTLSAETKAELHSSLSAILSGVMTKVKEGDAVAAVVATRVAVQRAALS